MTETAQAAARANRHGDPCPPWCDADHHRHVPAIGGYTDSHHGARTEIRASGDGITLYTRGGVSAFLREGHQQPIAIVSGSRYTDGRALVNGDLLLTYRDAHQMANIVEALADMRPEQLRQLAAGIRATAEAIGDAR